MISVYSYFAGNESISPPSRHFSVDDDFPAFPFEYVTCSLEALWGLIFNILFTQSWFEISEWGVYFWNGYPIPPD